MRKDKHYLIRFDESYGPFKLGIDYWVIDRGYDFFLIRCNGHNYCVPNTFVERKHFK